MEKYNPQKLTPVVEPRRLGSLRGKENMVSYKPQQIEKKWQKIWEKEAVFEAKNKSKKPKFYVLVEFPYPSGEGLHVGHCRSYVAMDVISRKRRMQDFNVLFPMGWDAFGLPTENYAIKTGIHPAIATKKNTDNFKKQQKSLGLSFDWSREINTADPNYYKWTQWIFIQLFKKGLAYKAKMPINWCSSCRIGLANEEVVNNSCERCGSKVEKKEREQWFLKITNYAERLIKDLDLVDYPGKVKISQKEWIGKSEGTEIQFKISPEGNPLASYVASNSVPHSAESISVFTTRPDTLFGATYLVLAPENPIIEKLKDKIINYKFVAEYVETAKSKLEKERISGEKEKTGVELKGVKAISPANGRELPIFIAEYVLMHYGTGAVMAVPSHDQRDFDFAKKYNLAIIEVIKPKEILPQNFDKAYEGEGILINSGRFDGIASEVAKKRIPEWLERQGSAKKATHYKLRDWIFSRQRYWGEPIPMIKCGKCARLSDGQGWQPVLEKDLPVKLPKVENYKPTKEGESPLAQVKSWVNIKCPECKGQAKRETDVMPNWAGSNWYYLRYCDPKNDKKLANPEILKYWMGPAHNASRSEAGGVDWYNGGMEHTTLHLLYSRFIFKFLWDIEAVPKKIGPEPYKKRTSHGMILGEGGVKMSKSKGNVLNPDVVVKQFGADAMRVYEMFIGPFDQMISWDSKGIKGVSRFLEKIWNVGNSEIDSKKAESSPVLLKLLHKTIKKVSEDIDNMKFNTAVSSLMEFVNAWSRLYDNRGSSTASPSGQADENSLAKKDFADFLRILSPFGPHIAEELWEKAGLKGFCSSAKWPEYEANLLGEKTLTLVIQVNGKIRDKIEVEAGISRERAEKMALASDKIKNWILGKKIKKIIFVPGKLINIVI